MLAALVIVALGVVQPAPAAGPSAMRWARGLVSAVSPTEITLKLRATSVTIGLDASTVFESATGAKAPSVGSVVEVHYTDKKKVNRAVLILHDGPSGSTELSRKPGHSYRGVTQGATKGKLKLVLGKRTQPLDLDSHTTLVDDKGQTLAKGKKDVGPLLKDGEPVLVKYDEDDDSTTVGDVVVPGSKSTALEVRRVRRR